jgi:hypothetical protein
MDLIFLKDFLYLALMTIVIFSISVGWFVWAIQMDGWLVWFLDLGSYESINKKYRRRGWDIPLRGK